jgi:hypothetical protein
MSKFQPALTVGELVPQQITLSILFRIIQYPTAVSLVLHEDVDNAAGL